MIRLWAPREWPLDDKILHYILLALKLSVSVAVGVALALGLWEWFFLSILALGLMFLPEMIESRAKVSLPVEFDAVLVVFIYASIFLGGVFSAYDRFWWWDAALHVSSGFILSFAGFMLLYVTMVRRKVQASPLLIGLIIFSFGMAFGGVWEIFEYAVDQLFGTNMQTSGLHDTMWDLIVDGVGSLVMAVIGTRYIVHDGKGFIARWIQNFIKENPHLKKGSA